MKKLIVLILFLASYSCHQGIIPESQKVDAETTLQTPEKASNPGACANCYWQYRDVDGDGFGNTDSVYKKKPQLGYVTKKGDCDDSNAAIHPDALDTCGTDLNCNGIPNEGVSFSTFFYDGDKDGYGNKNDSLTSCNNTVPDYVSNSTDCNDGDIKINPAAIELLNGIDDNCNGSVDEGLVQPGITITTSSVLIPEFMGAGGTNEMFAQNDPNDPAWLVKIKPGNFSSWVHTEGHNSQWFRWAVPFGSKGNGFNPTKPAPCDIMNGDLCKSYTRDFNLSWLDLINNTGGKPIYTCNIARGTLAELYYVIDTRPDLKIIMYGQELPSGDENYRVLDSKTYPPKFYTWVDSVKKRYPSRILYHCSDMPDIGGKKTTWVNDFLNYKKLPVGSALRQYSHGFTHYTLTGKINNDSAEYTEAVTTSLQQEMNDINASFLGSYIFFSQFSTGVPGYALGINGNTFAVQGRCIDVMYYMRAHKVWIEANMAGSFKMLGANFIGLKNLLTKLDFKWVGILNNLYSIPRYSTTISHTMGPQVDVLAGYSNEVLALVIQNRSGNTVAIPEYFLLDGELIKSKAKSAAGYLCESLSSTTGSTFNPLTNNTMAPFSIAYIEYTK